jgi:hypothetical protein
MVKHLTLIFLSLFLLSCATRKVAVTKSNVELRVDSVVIEKKDSSFVQQNAISIKEDIDEIEVVPIDTAKPIIIGGKEYFNATVRIKKTKREIIDTTKTTVVKSEQKQTEVKKDEKRELFVKSVDKKPSYFNLWWLLLIPLGVWLLRRYLLK